METVFFFLHTKASSSVRLYNKQSVCLSAGFFDVVGYFYRQSLHMIINELSGIFIFKHDVKVTVCTFSLFKLGIQLRALMLELRIKLENIDVQRS